MKNKRNVYLISIILFAILLAFGGFAYAYFTSSISGEFKEVLIETGDLTLSLDGGSSIDFAAAPGDSVTKTVNITNPNNKEIFYDIGWVELSNTFINGELHISMNCTSYLNYDNANKAEYGNCSGLTDGSIGNISQNIKSSISIGAGVTHEYEITITFIETNSVQNYNKGKDFNGKLKIMGSVDVSYNWYDDCDLRKSLRCKMITADTPYADNVSSPNVSSNTGINFGAKSSSTNGNGVYYTVNPNKTDNGERVYYYRGEVENNYVKYGSYCWRMVRTTENGGVKLVYAGLPVNDVCPQTGTSVNALATTTVYNSNGTYNNYVGYMYGSTCNTYESCHTNRIDSVIKGKIDTWYDTNINAFSTKLKSYIMDTPYCSDRKVGNPGVISNVTYYSYGYTSNLTIYEASRRLATGGNTGNTWVSTNANPTYVCPQDNDKFTVSLDNGNGNLTYPVALLTADEVSYAGQAFGVANQTNYLYSGNEYQYTMTPSLKTYSSNTHYIYMFGYCNNGSMCHLNNQSAYNVRPVITINSFANVVGGDGSALSPYIIQ